MVFQFEHMVLDQEEGKEKWDLAPLPFVELKQMSGKMAERSCMDKGWNSLFWDNHDLPRIVSRWGDDGEIPGGVRKNAGYCASWNAGNAIYLSGRRAGDDECPV